MAGAMLASLSQAVYLLNAPLAQAARLVGALQAKAEQDPSILAGGAGTPAESEVAQAADEAPEATTRETTDAPAPAAAEGSPADETTNQAGTSNEATASDEAETTNEAAASSEAETTNEAAAPDEAETTEA